MRRNAMGAWGSGCAAAFGQSRHAHFVSLNVKNFTNWPIASRLVNKVFRFL
jgi:hypothetical protein